MTLLRRPQSIIRRAFRRLRNDQGTQLVEFAVVAIMLLTFMFGIIDFSRFMYTYHFVSDAAREGTRYAAVRGSTFTTECTQAVPFSCYALSTDVQTFVRAETPEGIISSSVAATATWPGALSGATGSCTTTANTTTKVDDNVGCEVKVVVSYPFHFILPMMSTATYTITSTSEMIIAQ